MLGPCLAQSKCSANVHFFPNIKEWVSPPGWVSHHPRRWLMPQVCLGPCANFPLGVQRVKTIRRYSFGLRYGTNQRRGRGTCQESGSG